MRFSRLKIDKLIMMIAKMQNNQKQPLFIHCAANLRVSAFLYIYRLTTQETDHQQACLDLVKIWQPNQTWQNFINHQLSQG